jgi:hypothetical protein
LKRLYIVVEGQTEEEFIKSLLLPYLNRYNIYDVNAVIIHTSIGHKGGFVNYQHLRNDIVKLLKNQEDIIVSTFIDYFRIPNNIPGYDNCIKNNPVISKRISCLQNAMCNDIPDYRFIPYIQQYEFESLLFSSSSGFMAYFENNIYNQIIEIINKYTCPEDINDGASTAPSKRLEKIIRNYDKILHGNLIAIENGMDSILKTCPGFKNWTENLINKLT